MLLATSKFIDYYRIESATDSIWDLFLEHKATARLVWKTVSTELFLVRTLSDVAYANVLKEPEGGWGLKSWDGNKHNWAVGGRDQLASD